MRGLFVTGSDTGVGKTVVACAIVRRLRAHGIDTGVMKPIETGVGREGPLDAMALQAAAGGADTLDEICPLQFALPAAPNVAAAAEHAAVDLARVTSRFARLADRHDAMVVEGAGGLLAPTTDQATMADLAASLGLPLLVVVRGALGTINHTRLTLAEARRRGLRVAGVVISHADGPLSEPDQANLGFLHDSLGGLLVGEVPPLADRDGAESHLDDAALQAAVGKR